MHLAAVFREVAGDLTADEGVGQVGYLQTAADHVVVGDGDVVHAARQCGLVQEPWRGVALRAVELAHGPVGRFVGMAGVDVQICFKGFHGGHPYVFW